MKVSNVAVKSPIPPSSVPSAPSDKVQKPAASTQSKANEALAPATSASTKETESLDWKNTLKKYDLQTEATVDGF